MESDIYLLFLALRGLRIQDCVSQQLMCAASDALSLGCQILPFRLDFTPLEHIRKQSLIVLTRSGSLVSPTKGFPMTSVILLGAGLKDGLADTGLRVIIAGDMVVIENAILSLCYLCCIGI